MALLTLDYIIYSMNDVLSRNLEDNRPGNQGATQGVEKVEVDGFIFERNKETKIEHVSAWWGAGRGGGG
jgi:hypothetical protein